MVVYNCAITGDQLMSDSHKQLDVMHEGSKVEGVFFIQSRPTKDSFNVIDEFNYKQCEMPSSYRSLMDMFKTYLRAVKKALHEKEIDSKPLMQSTKAILPFLKKNYKEMEMYVTKSRDTKSFVLAWYDDYDPDEETLGIPKFLYFKHALIEEKS